VLSYAVPSALDSGLSCAVSSALDSRYSHTPAEFVGRFSRTHLKPVNSVYSQPKKKDTHRSPCPREDPIKGWRGPKSAP